MTKILALIRTEGLSTDEAVVASGTSAIGAVFEFQATHYDDDYQVWLKENKPTESFQTTKDLKTLEKQFTKLGMAVYLHEKNLDKNCGCGHDKFWHGKGECHKGFMQTEDMSWIQCKCRGYVSIGIEPLMLAVFGDEKLVRGLV